MKYGVITFKRSSPQINLVGFSEDQSSSTVQKIWFHPNEFFDIKVSPQDSSLFLADTGVVSDGKTTRSVSILSFPTDSHSDSVSVLQELVRKETEVKSIFWESNENVVVGSSSGLAVYRLDIASHCVSSTRSLQAQACTASVADPHHPFSIAFSENRSLSLWDFRTKEASLTLKTSHFFPIKSIDANPNMENIFVTGGEDGRMMFWDIRKPLGSFPLKSVDAHAHHVTSVKFHPIHDQLVLSCGTDCAVNVWKFRSISSSPPKGKPLVEVPQRRFSTTPVDTARELDDKLIQQTYGHEDSVNRVCWSGWCFASASKDGTVMFNSVAACENIICDPCLRMNWDNQHLRAMAVVAAAGLGSLAVLRIAKRFIRKEHHSLSDEFQYPTEETENLNIYRPPSTSTGPSSPAVSPRTFTSHKIIPKTESDVLFFSILDTYNSNRTSPCLTEGGASSTPSISEPSTTARKKKRNNRKRPPN